MELVKLSKHLLNITLLAVLWALISSEAVNITTQSLITCKNNGTQSLLNSSTCECIKPWTGDHCTDYPCVHGLSVGDKFDENSIFFNKRCICDTGYTGDLCDTPIINPCGSHGTFSENSCICKPNYTGPKCEFVEYCLNGQLSNGRCICHYGWTSDICDTILCHQGISDETGLNCTCNLGFRGRFCDFCEDSESSPYPECAKLVKDNIYLSKQTIIIAGVLLTVICSSALIFIVVLRRMKRKSNRRKYSATDEDFGKRMQLMKRDDQ